MDSRFIQGWRISKAMDYTAACDDLDRSERLVLIAMAGCCTDEKDNLLARASLLDLQNYAKYSQRTIRRTLQGLEEKKLIETILKPTRGNAGEWRLCYDREVMLAARRRARWEKQQYSGKL
jgi:hypothetical protein